MLPSRSTMPWSARPPALGGPGRHSRAAYSFLRRRAMTMDWIWLVPSMIWKTLASRMIFSTGYSLVYPLPPP